MNDPLFIIKKASKVAYRLQLLTKLKIHTVFHVTCLMPYHEDLEDLT